MFDAFSDGSYYEFPSFEIAFFSILISFALSSVIAFTYHLTNQGAALSRNFVQAMILSSIVTCMVIMAVGNNVAAGFGIMGAIAIIRFRMRVENPRNIIFIFASLSVGIAAGVYGYSIAIAGTSVFSIIAFLLYASPYGSKRLNKEFSLTFLLLTEIPVAELQSILREKCEDFRMLTVANRNRGDRYEYFVTLRQEISKDEFYAFLKSKEGIENVKMERSDNLSKL
ncbi:MAG: DUF4956 domain-containing protein [Reichenbachiella sp.]